MQYTEPCELCRMQTSNFGVADHIINIEEYSAGRGLSAVYNV